MAYQLEDLLTLMARLREPVYGCPWDLKQNYKTIAPSTIEEAYEVVDAIEREHFNDLREELGDLLFQVIFYSQLGAEDGHFEFADIVHGLVSKLVRRHPHVFPDGTLESRCEPNGAIDQTQVKSNWEEIKQAERADKGYTGVLDDVPSGLPATTRAVKLQKRAANVGFDWPSSQGVYDKIVEELDELRDAELGGTVEHIEEELGDLLFCVINLSRHLKVDPEAALRRANRKFGERFGYIEQKVEQRWQDYSLDELDAFWDEAKKK